MCCHTFRSWQHQISIYCCSPESLKVELGAGRLDIRAPAPSPGTQGWIPLKHRHLIINARGYNGISIIFVILLEVEADGTTETWHEVTCLAVISFLCPLHPPPLYAHLHRYCWLDSCPLTPEPQQPAQFSVYTLRITSHNLCMCVSSVCVFLSFFHPCSPFLLPMQLSPGVPPTLFFILDYEQENEHLPLRFKRSSHRKLLRFKIKSC